MKTGIKPIEVIRTAALNAANLPGPPPPQKCLQIPSARVRIRAHVEGMRDGGQLSVESPDRHVGEHCRRQQMCIDPANARSVQAASLYELQDLGVIGEWHLRQRRHQ